MLITAGGLGAGSTRLHDPLLESLHLSWLRFGHGLVLSSVLLWGGVALMLLSGCWLGRRVIERHRRPSTRWWRRPDSGWRHCCFRVPVFSRDTYSYLAQGALLRDGFDPYIVGPIDNPNSLLDNVSPIWTTTTAPYGPAFILVAKFVTMLVGNDVVAGTMLLRLCMLPGLVMLIWAAPRVARHVGANGAAALWICVLNPLVIIHLMGGVHNEMLMVGLMMAAHRADIRGHHLLGRQSDRRRGGGEGHRGNRTCRSWCGCGCADCGNGEARARAGVRGRDGGVGADLRRRVRRAVLAGGRRTRLADGARRVGEDHQLADGADRGGKSDQRRSADCCSRSISTRCSTSRRIIGIAVIAISLPLLWWRFRHADREALIGIALAMVVVVLFVPAALPWYYTWPLAVVSALAQSRPAIAVIAGFSTWIMVIFKPDGSHGMYSWMHVLLATACAAAAWYSLLARGTAGAHAEDTVVAVSTPWPAPDAPPRGPDASAGRRPAGRSAVVGRPVAADRQRRIGGEQPAQDLGLVVAAVVQHHQQTGQALHHVPGVVEEGLRHHIAPSRRTATGVASRRC